MGFESTLPLKKHEENKNEEFGTSQVAICESTVKEEVNKQSLTAEKHPFVAEVITPTRADILEQMVDNLSIGGCQTPRESIFDPFAPGPEEVVVCAPIKKKEIITSSVLSRRQLDFETGNCPIKSLSFVGSDDAEHEVDQYLLDQVENIIFDLIMSHGLPDDRQEKIETTAPIDDISMTPDSKLPLLAGGIATTCPDAPMRSSLKASKLSPSICRKIDFDSVSTSADNHGSSSVVKD